LSTWVKVRRKGRSDGNQDTVAAQPTRHNCLIPLPVLPLTLVRAGQNLDSTHNRKENQMITSIRKLHSQQRAVALSVAMLLAAATVGALLFPERADAGTMKVKGTFMFQGAALLECPLGTLNCATGTISGDIDGDLVVAITFFVPSPKPLQVLFFNGEFAIHTANGDLFCTTNGANNINASSQGEFGEICVIHSGTGVYQGASGHLRLFGTSSVVLNIPTGKGDYKGTIITP